MSNMSIIRQAYCLVNGVTEEEAGKEPAVSRMASAISDILGYPGALGEETIGMTQARQAKYEWREDVQAVDIADSLKEAYSDLPGEETAWPTVFRVQNKIQENEKESNNMENKTNNESLDALMAAEEKERTREDLLNEVASNVEVKSASSAQMKAFAERQAANAAVKKKFEEKAVPTIVFAKEAAREILGIKKDKEGNDIPKMGTVRDVDKALRDFKEKSGFIAGTGEMPDAFPNAKDPEEAREVYRLLLEAKENPDKEFEVYVSNAQRSIKGFGIAEDVKSKTEYYTKVNLISKFLDISAVSAYVNGESVNGGIQLQAIQIADRATRARRERETIQENKVSLAKCIQVKIVNREELAKSHAVYHKVKSIKMGQSDKFKLKTSFEYITKRKGELAADKTPLTKDRCARYRVPCITEAYSVSVEDKDLAAVFGTGVGVGAVTVGYDTDPELRKKMEREIQDKMLWIAANATPGEGEPLSGILAEIEKIGIGDDGMPDEMPLPKAGAIV